MFEKSSVHLCNGVLLKENGNTWRTVERYPDLA